MNSRHLQGDVVIPVARPVATTNGRQGLGTRQMAQLGLYAGVEYKVVGIEVARGEDEGSRRQKFVVRSLAGLGEGERWVRFAPSRLGATR
jgi:hypothetical protein